MPREEDDLPGDEDEEISQEQPRRPGKNGQPQATKERPKPAPSPEEEPEEEEEQPQVHKHPGNLVRLAKHFGIPQSEIDSTPTEQLLLAVKVEVEAAKARRPEPKPDEKKAPKDDEFEFDHEIEFGESDEAGRRQRRKAKASDYDPAIQQIVRQNQELRKRLDEREKADQQRDQNRILTAIDDAFVDLDDPTLFGDVSKGTLGEDELARRRAVVGVSGIKEGDSGRTVARKIARAKAQVYGAKKSKRAAEEDEDEEPERRSAKPKKRTRAERWEEAQVSRPTNRRGATPVRSMEAAASELSQLMIDAGFDPGPRRNTADDETLGDDDDL